MNTTQLAATAFVTGLFVVAGFSREAAGAPKILQVGDPLPDLEGHTLTGRAIILPRDSPGNVTRGGLGFAYASRKPVEAWAEWFRKTIDPKKDVAFFEVP